MCDVYLHTGIMYPGGQALNFAVYAASLGAQADYMGVFGSDAVAAHVKAVLDRKQIGRSHCRTFEGENGYARVTLKDGDRTFRGSNRGGVLQTHPIFLDAEDLAYAAGFDVIYTTNNGFTDGLLPELCRLPGAVSYDFSYRWDEEDRVKRVCPYIDFAFLSCSALSDEETEALCLHLRKEGCRVVTATRGSKGATVFDGIRFYHQAPDYVEPVDTMGAGDSFATAMLVALFEVIGGKSGFVRMEKDPGLLTAAMPKALKAAAVFAAGTCLVSGAFGEGMAVPDSMRGIFYEGEPV